MSLLLLLAASKGAVPNLVTQTFTGNATWVAPATTTSIQTLTGTGQDGIAGTSGYNDAPTNHDATVVFMSGYQYSSDTSPYPDHNSAGQWDWANVQNDAPNAAATINGGGSGTVYRLDVQQYGLEYHYSITGIPFTNAIPGSASSSVGSFWQTSGPLMGGQQGESFVHWQEYGAFHAGTSGSNGANASGFGFTFAGGVAGPATPSVQSGVAVTPGNSYPMVIPAGASITLTYFQ